jgi:hypothetical protein
MEQIDSAGCPGLAPVCLLQFGLKYRKKQNRVNPQIQKRWIA